MKRFLLPSLVFLAALFISSPVSAQYVSYNCLETPTRRVCETINTDNPNLYGLVSVYNSGVSITFLGDRTSNLTTIRISSGEEYFLAQFQGEDLVNTLGNERLLSVYRFELMQFLEDMKNP